jgi:hypothetical protein
MVTRSIAAMVLAGSLIIVDVRDGNAHPLHTTLTEISVDASRHTVRAVVRLFADDLAAALARHPSLGGNSMNDRAAAYVGAALSLSARGRALPMRSCGVRRSGDLLWVCLESTMPEGVDQLSARNPLLLEAFSDQVNIVQIGDGPTRRSVLFLKGDRDKPL